MTDNEALIKAFKICLNAHRGQVDKVGEDYCLHPITVMVNLTHSTNDEKIVALLHDVVEDSGWTMADLVREGFSADVLIAVAVLTRTSNFSYSEYIQGVARYPIAVKVKIADLEHNMDTSRLQHRGPKDDARLIEYGAAMRFLKKGGYKNCG